MAWVIVSIIAVIIVGICLMVFIGSKPTQPGDSEDARLTAAGIAILVAAIWGVITIIFSISTLSTGQVGLVYNFAGKLTGVKQNPGVIWKAPWTSIRKESVQIQREDFPLDSANAAVTKDQQEITAHLAINYEVDPNHVFDLYKNVGAAWKQKLIDSRVLQDFKEVTATYHTVDITNHREGLRKDTLNRLRRELAPYSVAVTDFFIQNIGFSKKYQDAITAKQVQVQKAQQAEAKVAQATAEARQQVQAAEGQAKAIFLVGRALRNNPEVLKLRALEKLNPKAQVIFCSNASCPSFLGSLAREGK